MRVLNIYGEKGTAVKSAPIPPHWTDANIWAYVERKSPLVFPAPQTCETKTIGTTTLFLINERIVAIARKWENTHV
ncbi:hypothetical protein [Actinotignum urinale]|uniref:Uncharacterized protein n=1 Tax=Actinotignum urinale TaxID=190146 RepID=A0ABU5G9E8_9ACTO|nr:hypothetical protein [Actinotignum urinale]MDY5132263.1 hypothetical protein [Actinotignum urinale]